MKLKNISLLSLLLCSITSLWGMHAEAEMTSHQTETEVKKSPSPEEARIRDAFIMQKNLLHNERAAQKQNATSPAATQEPTAQSLAEPTADTVAAQESEDQGLTAEDEAAIKRLIKRNKEFDSQRTDSKTKQANKTIALFEELFRAELRKITPPLSDEAIKEAISTFTRKITSQITQAFRLNVNREPGDQVATGPDERAISTLEDQIRQEIKLAIESAKTHAFEQTVHTESEKVNTALIKKRYLITVKNEKKLIKMPEPINAKYNTFEKAIKSIRSNLLNEKPLDYTSLNKATSELLSALKKSSPTTKLKNWLHSLKNRANAKLRTLFKKKQAQ